MTQNIFQKNTKYNQRNLSINCDYFFYLASVSDVLTVKNRALQTFGSENLNLHMLEKKIEKIVKCIRSDICQRFQKNAMMTKHFY